jgi:type IV pilus assembly protein PilN
MIRINLLGDDTVIDPSGLWILVGYTVTVIVFLFVFFLMHVSTLRTISALEPEISSLERQLNEIRSTTREVRELDKKRAELKEKTGIIALLKRSKRGPVRVLDDLNTALPEKCWIESAVEDNGKFKITGLSLEDQSVANFMTALEASSFYSNVELIETQQVEMSGFRLKKFIIDSVIHYAGEAGEPNPSPSPSPIATAEVHKTK